ncbi:hypothetical protein TNCV_3639441 [Trichonephila clavipes]|nr:hypothetical protein TNCV_3639441 [Trichonephila clavipes]
MWRRRRGHSLDDDVFREFLRAITTLYPPMEEDVPSMTDLNTSRFKSVPNLVPNPEDKFAVMECFVNNPSEYMRALTPTRFRSTEALQIVKRKSRNRRKRSKIQKPDIEIKRVPHRSRNATPTEITTDDEDMITYDMEEEELEQDPFILPEGYLRALTPSRYRNYRE